MMIARSRAELRHNLQDRQKKIAFVPTMGCLHAGHISLIEQARAVADIVIVSIYVNPLQFGPNEDLAAYPRNLEDDRVACLAAGVDVLFHPASLYAENGAKITLTIAGLDDCLCGASRPGHFDGVATVVNILFNIVQPDIAIFGEKDWQQLVIIRRMVDDLQMPVEVIGVPTMREADGLAMSSRNRYLSDTDRIGAVVLSGALRVMQQAADHGETDVRALIACAEAMLTAAGIQPEYLEVRDAESLALMDQLSERAARAFIAARIGKARLIDNMSLVCKA